MFSVRSVVRLSLRLFLLSFICAPGADAQDQRTKGAVPPTAIEKTTAGPALSDRGLELGEPLPVFGYDVIGFIETVRIAAAKLDVNAKIDSGARSSSLDARRIEPFMRDGAQWVRFMWLLNQRASTQEPSCMTSISPRMEHMRWADLRSAPTRFNAMYHLILSYQ